jgi:hypothetical protein
MSPFTFKTAATILSITALTLSFNTISTAQIEKTFVRSFYVSNQTVTLNLGDNVTIEKWADDNATVRVEMYVQVENKNITNDLIKNLAANGRYLIASDTQEPRAKEMVIAAPNISTQLQLNGQALKENIRYIVRIPKNAKVANPILENLYADNK